MWDLGWEEVILGRTKLIFSFLLYLGYWFFLAAWQCMMHSIPSLFIPLLNFFNPLQKTIPVSSPSRIQIVYFKGRHRMGIFIVNLNADVDAGTR